MIRPLTGEQVACLQQMRDAGLHWVAAETERQWEQGCTYYIDRRVPTSRALRHAFKQGNIDALTPLPAEIACGP